MQITEGDEIKKYWDKNNDRIQNNKKPVINIVLQIKRDEWHEIANKTADWIKLETDEGSDTLKKKQASIVMRELNFRTKLQR